MPGDAPTTSAKAACPQCRGDNDSRAVECGYCGASLRQPYRGDPLGVWLEELDREFIAGYRDHWFGTLLFAITCLAPPAAGLVGYWEHSLTATWSVALAVGAFCLLGGLVTPIENHLETRRRSRAFEAVFLPRLEAFAREHHIEPWRLLVVCGESFERKGLLRGYLLRGRLAGKEQSSEERA